MSSQNAKSRIIPIRLPLDVVTILERRINKGRWSGLAEYLRERITYDTRRSHYKRNPEKPGITTLDMGTKSGRDTRQSKCNTPPRGEAINGTQEKDTMKNPPFVYTVAAWIILISLAIAWDIYGVVHLAEWLR